MLPVSLDCPFLIAPSIFSNVYLLGERRYNELTCEIWDDVEKHETQVLANGKQFLPLINSAYNDTAEIFLPNTNTLNNPNQL
jgi:hypothetical protein